MKKIIVLSLILFIAINNMVCDNPANDPVTYTVTYKGNGNTGGSVPNDLNTYENGETVVVLGNNGNLTKTGHTFDNWNTTSNGSGIDYAPGATFTMGSANLTLYAQWVTNQTYIVTYYGNGNTGGNVPTDANDYLTGETVTVLDNIGNLTKNGCTFDDWNTASNGSGIDYTPGATFTIGSENVNLYAQWKVTGTVTDIDGNVYRTIQIGNQVWTVENFRTTKYNDGTSIPNLTDNTAWANDNFGAYCYYNNTTNADSIKKFGALYNWFAVNNEKLAPIGWHVPSHAEWNVLEEYLIANGYNWDGTTTGNKIGKSLASKTDWKISTEQGHVGNSLTNNSTGFTGLPGGWRKYDGTFMSKSEEGEWWSSTEISTGSPYASRRELGYDREDLYAFSFNKEFGLSVKLIMD